MTARYRVVTVDGNETAEKTLNEWAAANERLVAAHVETVHEGSAGAAAQDNVMLGDAINRFTFILVTD
jgi:hypothetical protein